ncbi:MAG TPA: TIGR00366 family protein [Blastocatellia bacterium]|nr:TIGR00366 family protein [Blastocatellia bacterium]
MTSRQERSDEQAQTATAAAREAKPDSGRDNLITNFSQLMGRWVPDAITASIFLMAALFVMALALGNTLTTTVDAYYRGLWMLLPFTMQMTLIIVLSSVVGASPLFRGIVMRLSKRPATATQVIALSLFIRSALSYMNWGLGLALGPLTTIYFAREAERKGIKIDFPFFLAAGYAAGSVWQFGLSASAPLLMATPGHFLESTTGVMPLSTTIWSPASIVLVTGFPIIIIVAACWFMPRNAQQLSEFPDAYKLAEPVREAEIASSGEGQPARVRNFSERLERNSLISALLSAALIAWLYYHFIVKGSSLDLNSLNTIFLLLCFVLHKNIYNFTKALQSAILSAWPIVVIYHLYAGVAGLLQYTNMGEVLSNMVSSISTVYTFPLLAALTGTAVAIFVPSSGGQWVIQGYVTSAAAEAVGVSAQRGLLALSIGDQMGNLTTPFWYVIIAGVARIEFRKFLGYGLLFAPLWFLFGVLVFTFLPC